MPRSIARRSPIFGRFRAPASKPETQRALVMGALGEGRTTIRGPLISRETLVMMDACRAIGADVAALPQQLEVEGIGRAGLAVGGPERTAYVWAAGSALVARLFATIGSAMPAKVVVDGNCNLRSRPFEPLFAALRGKGVEFAHPDNANRLPAVALSRELPGGRYELATSVSSQFTTALLVPAPLAARPTEIELVGPAFSLSYIRQTTELMRRFGVAVATSADERVIHVPNDRLYQGRDLVMTGDFTSASYLLGAAFVTRGRITVANLDPANQQGERAIVEILERLGAVVAWDGATHTLDLDCTRLPAEVDEAFDLSDCPNILPTVAAVAATMRGRVRITGARLTQNHKSRRIDAMAVELGKAGVPVTVLHDDEGMVDGLEVRGRPVHRGEVAFSSHGDHRIFMSLALFALSCERACLFSDADDTADSFPDFGNVLGLGSNRKEKSDEHQLVAG